MRNRFLAAIAFCLAPVLAQAADFRVCSDPNNLPFSNRAGEGFENKIAELVARDLDERLTYTWAEQHEGFLRRTMKAGICDVVMAAPAGMDDVAETRPYYTSNYVFVSRAGDNLKLSSLTDPRLRTLKIGVHLLGDDSTPPAAALGQQGIVNNVKGFVIYGDYAKANPAARLIEGVQDGSIDVAAAWGPLAGYFAKHSRVPLTVTPITHTAQFAPLMFRFSIAMGVRPRDAALLRRLDAVLASERAAIQTILTAYGVPLASVEGGDSG
jgi:mxaJ protein